MLLLVGDVDFHLVLLPLRPVLVDRFDEIDESGRQPYHKHQPEHSHQDGEEGLSNGNGLVEEGEGSNERVEAPLERKQVLTTKACSAEGKWRLERRRAKANSVPVSDPKTAPVVHHKIEEDEKVGESLNVWVEKYPLLAC